MPLRVRTKTIHQAEVDSIGVVEMREWDEDRRTKPAQSQVQEASRQAIAVATVFRLTVQFGDEFVAIYTSHRPLFGVFERHPPETSK